LSSLFFLLPSLLPSLPPLLPLLFFPTTIQGFLLPSPTPNLTTYYSIDKQVSPPSLPPSLLPSFPPTFLYHSQEDKTVSVDNSIRLAAALRTAGVRKEGGREGGKQERRNVRI
jgi:hypothetical protein